jgi:hypothetical protein
MTNQKHHPKLNQINHLGHAGRVQNVSKDDWMAFLVVVQNGFFFH